MRTALARWVPLLRFRDSTSYWRTRYRLGGDSGAGSRGNEAIYKARIVNEFARHHDVRSVIEFGCGDGQQLALADYPAYLGIDISVEAIRRCQQRFRVDHAKRFTTEYRGERADLALSLDVLYHLIENDVYDSYLARLFGAAERFVVIYSTDREGSTAKHMRHRTVSRDIAERFPAFNRLATEDPPHDARFLMYQREHR